MSSLFKKKESIPFFEKFLLKQEHHLYQIPSFEFPDHSVIVDYIVITFLRCYFIFQTK